MITIMKPYIILSHITAKRLAVWGILWDHGIWQYNGGSPTSYTKDAQKQWRKYTSGLSLCTMERIKGDHMLCFTVYGVNRWLGKHI